MQNKLHIKIGDTVRVITGESKGQEGEILTIDRINLRAVVKGLNLVKKHVKPTASNPQGGIEEKESPIHISNVSLLVDNVNKDEAKKETKSNTRNSKKKSQ